MQYTVFCMNPTQHSDDVFYDYVEADSVEHAKKVAAERAEEEWGGRGAYCIAVIEGRRFCLLTGNNEGERNGRT